MHKKILTNRLIFLVLFLMLSACSKGAKKKELFVQAEYIFRNHDEFFFKPQDACLRACPLHSWEEKNLLTLITKEHFRCKGSCYNPPAIQVLASGEKVYHFDCTSHSLPLHEGKEFIYPALIELLNYVQNKTGRRVVITSGHRCPKHNLYVDHSKNSWGSKHMIGAEVDFYVEGMESEPLSIIALLQEYYMETTPFSSSSAYTTFERYEKGGSYVSTLPWYNKEIFIKLYLPHEGRNCDNDHAFAYIGIQLRYDRDLQCRVSFDPERSENYLRD